MANKTTIRKFFLAIRHDDRGLVNAMLMQDATLANVCAMAPPKKDDGQSPLQVALKTGKTSIANALLDHGANVNFMEASAVNAWRAPALHDAIKGAVVWAGPRVAGYEHWFPASFGLVQRMLELGADPNAVDSFGNTCFDRVVLDANQKSDTGPDWDGATGREVGLVINALVQHGGDPRRIGQHGMCSIDWARGHPVERLFESWRVAPP